MNGFYRGYLRYYAQRTAVVHKCLKVCRLGNNPTELRDPWIPECEAEHMDI